MQYNVTQTLFNLLPTYFWLTLYIVPTCRSRFAEPDYICDTIMIVRYMNFFPEVAENSSTLLFEKTANYFDSSKAPMRTRALLPEAKIIVILNDPIRRAYSWFQVSDS